MRIKLVLSGDDDIRRKLEKLGKRVATAVQKKALRAGSTPVLQAFRSVAPVGKTGNLKRAQTRKFKTYPSGISIAVIGADYAIGPHAHLVEWGTQERYRKKFQDRPRRGYTGRMKPTQVFTKAFQAVRARAESAMENTLITELEKEVSAL